MQLVYFDESGNTGTNFNDKQQPIFVLGGLIVPDTQWQSLVLDLESSLEKHFPRVEKKFEVHANDLRNGKGVFDGIPINARNALRDEWIKVGVNYELKYFYQPIVKQEFQEWNQKKFGSGIIINPHVVAFQIMAREVNRYISSLPDNQYGMFISDENKEIVKDIEKSIQVLRSVDNAFKLTHIVEKGFFIDSAKSRPLQLCDLVTYYIRKREEASEQHPSKELDSSAFELIRPMVQASQLNFQDMLSKTTK